MAAATSGGPVLRGSRVLLRAFRSDEFEILLEGPREWLPDALRQNESYWRNQTAKRIADSGTWGSDGLDLAIEVDGELVGAVQALRLLPLCPRMCTSSA
jgi:hypothetical protein